MSHKHKPEGEPYKITERPPDPPPMRATKWTPAKEREVIDRAALNLRERILKFIEEGEVGIDLLTDLNTVHMAALTQPVALCPACKDAIMTPRKTAGVLECPKCKALLLFNK